MFGVAVLFQHMAEHADTEHDDTIGYEAFAAGEDAKCSVFTSVKKTKNGSSKSARLFLLL